MATSKTERLVVAEIDFDSIKTNLKSFFQGQTDFADYDFDSSGLSFLLDVLSYNTHYNAMYTNLLASEMFLDSATTRSAVVSRAKMLGYTPTSRRAATATIDIVIGQGSGSSITVPKDTAFTASVPNTTGGSRTITFLTDKAYTAVDQSGGIYHANNAVVREGISRSFDWRVSSQTPDQRYIIPHKFVDVNTIAVVVKPNPTSVTEHTYTKAGNITTANASANVFFVQEADNNFYELVFGDGSFVGNKLTADEIVTATYLVTGGELGNGVKSFKSASPIGGFANVIVTTVSNASLGANQEDTNSIKFLAPKSFQTQDRLVTVEDYKTEILNAYTNSIDSVAVWGGEVNDPPDFGRVYISINPKIGHVFSQVEKDTLIRDVIGPKKIIGVSPIVVDPDVLNLVLTVTSKWNKQLTTKTASTLEADISAAVVAFDAGNLSKFNTQFRHSVLATTIDALNKAILSTLVGVKLKKRFTPVLGSSQGYTLKFYNQLHHPFTTYTGTLTSDKFTLSGTANCTLDDSNGVIRVISSTGTVVSSDVGTVNYATGRVDLKAFAPTAVSTTDGLLGVVVDPESDDVIPSRNVIVTIIAGDVTVKLVDDSTVIAAGTV